MEKYNLDKLVKVQCNDFYPSRWVKYKKEMKFLGITLRKEGFYLAVTNSYIGLEIPKNHTLIDAILYENPEVVLHYESGHSKTYYFNSVDEATKWANEITFFGKWQS